MIKKICVRRFKKFADQEFEIPGHLVVAGPNNSGKTSLLQAVAAWMEIALRWCRQHPDKARDADGNYLSTNITVDSFGSVFLPDFDHLWTNKETNEPITVGLETDRWNISFEFWHKESELVAVRPASDVKENDLEVLAEKLDDSSGKAGRYWRPVYIPPVSGVVTQEDLLAREAAVWGYLARADAGRVLRNLLWRVRENGRWDELNDVIKDFFNYELMTLGSDGQFIRARYRHFHKIAEYDLISVGSGFLQVLLIYAVILGRPSTVYLMDEPDAHLHISLQKKLFGDLLDRAAESQFQIIIATHSECLVREVRKSNLRLLDANGKLQKIDKRKVSALLDLVKPAEAMEALREKHRLLYLEGPTDIRILRAWADTLGHRCRAFLEETTPVETAQRGNEHFSAKHFSAVRELVPEVRGVELCDGDKKPPENSKALSKNRKESPLKTLFWDRKEIESYLLHPSSVDRYLQSKSARRLAEKAYQGMEENLPQKFLDDPFVKSPFLFLDQLAIKKFFSYLFQEAGLAEPSNEDFISMAEQMTVEEIHPEVRDKLDKIAEHFGIQEGEVRSQVNAATGKSGESKT